MIVIIIIMNDNNKNSNNEILNIYNIYIYMYIYMYPIGIVLGMYVLNPYGVGIGPYRPAVRAMCLAVDRVVPWHRRDELKHNKACRGTAVITDSTTEKSPAQHRTAIGSDRVQ